MRTISVIRPTDSLRLILLCGSALLLALFVGVSSAAATEDTRTAGAHRLVDLAVIGGYGVVCADGDGDGSYQRQLVWCAFRDGGFLLS